MAHVLVVGALASSLGAVACAPPTAGDKVKADLETMRSETTADKLLDRGKAFATIGDSTRAEEYLAAAIEQGADPKEALPLLMNVCITAGRYRAAAQYAEGHLRRHPDDVRTRFVLATLYVALGENQPARTNLERVVEQRPNDANAQYALAVLARDADNDLVDADKHFREYLRLDPNGAHAEEAKSSLLKRVP